MATTATDTPTLPATIRQALEDLDRNRDRKRDMLLSLVPLITIAEIVSAQFPEQRPGPYSIHQAVHADEVNGYAWLCVELTDMDQLAPIRRALHEHGLSLAGERSDHLDSGYFTLPHKDADGRTLMLCVVLPIGDTKPGARCRLVQRGTKEVPNYVIECG